MQKSFWGAGYHAVERSDGGDSEVKVEVIAGMCQYLHGTLYCTIHNMIMEDPDLTGELECPTENCYTRGVIHVV